MLHSRSLTENKDFRQMYLRAKSLVGPGLVTYYRKNRLGVNRVGITTSKKIGKAVTRNRARRIIREAYRLLEPGTAKGFDLVFVARGRTPFLKTGQISQMMAKQLSAAGVLASDGARRP